MNNEDHRLWRPPGLETIDDAAKIKAFDRLYKMSFDHYATVAEDGIGSDEDASHEIYEEVMKRCLGKDIFKHYNRLDL